LYSKVHCQDERPHTRDETREKRVERKAPKNDAVSELKGASEHNIEQEQVDDLEVLWSGFSVFSDGYW